VLRSTLRTVLLPAVLIATVANTSSAGQSAATVWRVDNLQAIGGHAVTVLGNPRVVATDIGPAVAFDGEDDGVFLDVNPVAGLSKFSIEILFQPSAGGSEEQRFLHFEDPSAGNRALIELRMRPDSQWALDTFLRSQEKGLTLLDRDRVHPAGAWHVAALTYDGRTMRHFVNGRLELSGEHHVAPMGAGRASIGVRQTRVSWFKGLIHSIRITPDALPADRLMTVPAGGGLADRTVIPLWPEGVPGARSGGGDERLVDGRIYNVQRPSLTYVAPTGPPTGTAVVICPGGSYARLAIANEAEGVAARLSAAGVASFILKYRLVEYGHPAPLQDVLRSIRLLRSRAGELGFAPDRIGVMGASAGGHVAASAATLFDAPEGRTGAALDAVSARPDFVALLYPVITMALPIAHADSRRNLLGTDPSPAVVQRLSLEHQVSSATPPTFMVHTAEDRSVVLEHSLLFYQAVRRAGVPAELHLYQRGAHGFGTRADLGPTSGWVDRWLEWLRSLNLVQPPDLKVGATPATPGSTS
jgi:acetyl esterase/lipase